MSQHQTTPASRAEATTALRALFEAFPADRGNGIGGAATYLLAVEGYSLIAIQKAVYRFIRGEFDWFNGKFLPTTAELSRGCRYCEDLIAPPKPLALPAPGDVIDDSPEAIARRQQHAENCRRNRFDWKQIADGKEPLEIDPVNPIDDYNGWEAREKTRLADESKSGKFRLSDEALGKMMKRDAA
ncbi:hypothetical protein [Bosea sp. (in: a-proteobacteria)]|uniref:hypothetical protein n=1 Tax=Bosea sp. (in: a-proteobacteria) TaxID=1871050 RepID=UPI00261E2BAB|nr:hypothetical protein [Bosea sp. (in: a-proteobacteria)]MCO5092039.1 hypothetical protein [Bosea sp. (in: a-proteobacteria)]